MKITWLGQAGLLLEANQKTILVDPYLSDSCEKKNPLSRRRMPIDTSFLKIKPDIILCTHNHLDHLDPDTLCHYLSGDSQVTCLTGENGWNELRKFGSKNNCVMMHPGTVWTEGGLTFKAVKAEHSDLTAVGFIVDDGERKYYITGDTLYQESLFSQLPRDVFAVFLPINGVGNNMNMEDAAKFAEQVGATYAVPIHWGLFDSLDPHDFSLKNKIIPEIYKEINF